MEEKFGLYIIDPIDRPENDEEDTFDYIFDNAIDSYKSNELGELLVTLIRGLNNDTISDQNFFFLFDLEKGMLLSDTPVIYSRNL